MFSKILNFFGKRFARFLNKPTSFYTSTSVYTPAELRAVLKPGDVVLIEGNLRMSSAIKYLTQSTWSHAAIYIGNQTSDQETDDTPVLIEADLEKGVIVVPLSKYCTFNTRICRPVRLTEDDCQKVVQYVTSRIGNSYDLKNVFDLSRYLIPTPPVPTKMRRRLLEFGSSEPTKAICSTLIAQAFQSVLYPILPIITREEGQLANELEILHIRHHSLFVPRDFDLSPYFQIVKPTLNISFNYKTLQWNDAENLK